MDDAASRWSSRKLWVVLIGMLLSSLLRYRNILSDDGYVTIMVTAILGYPITNVAQRAVEKKSSE